MGDDERRAAHRGVETVAAPYRLEGDRETLERDINAKAARPKGGTGG